MSGKLYRILALVIIVPVVASPASAQAIPATGVAPPAVSAPQDTIPEGEGFDLDAGGGAWWQHLHGHRRRIR